MRILDTCDDWEPTQQMLGLDEQDRAAGVCAVVGMDASPGISDLSALHGLTMLDGPAQGLSAAWPVDVPGSGTGRQGKQDDEQLLDPNGRPSAAAVHRMDQTSVHVAVVDGGRLVHQRPLTPVMLAVAPKRSDAAYTVGRPEPVTSRRSFHSTGKAVNLMVITPGTLAYLDLLHRSIDSGRLTNETAATDLARPSIVHGLHSALTPLGRKGPGTLSPFSATATATGTRHDDPVIDPERFFRGLARQAPRLRSDRAPDRVAVDVTLADVEALRS
ncbi:hypothetical protein HS041_27715 [Planomonospora sp. ID67723]|uniref:hypothetical protein n=1 Tax=Planomonospora sp. ID67723 TaxID=2738134 RepID=UPI0018C3D6BC|nr:hypothetical protein [Planomonospora sp. ID67723]MBG0831529.1 hypothetical protein [Planomonospora sp. ID67723]